MSLLKPSDCACTCCCCRDRLQDGNGLCDRCWTEWCQASTEHAPVADNSYLGTYGITGLWTGWLISRGEGHVVGEGADFLQRYEWAKCPAPFCEQRMVRRPGAWKCYRHKEPVVVVVPDRLPRSPRVKVPLGEAL